MKADGAFVPYLSDSPESAAVIQMRIAANNFSLYLSHLLKFAYVLLAGSLCAALSCEFVAQFCGIGAISEQVSPPAQPTPSMLGIRQRWSNFVRETASPLTLGAGAFNAAFSQVTGSDPRYGVNSVAFCERLGASEADIVGS
jgi:hypothetical protein